MSGGTAEKLLSRPVLIAEEHDVRQFDCGKQDVNDWLRKRALKNTKKGYSSAYVACNEAGVVLAYHSLTAGALPRSEMPRKLRHGTPRQVPTVLLGQLGVDKSLQGRGIGRHLFADAAFRAVNQARTASGFHLFTVRSHPDTVGFYEALGMRRFNADSDEMFITLVDLTEAIASLLSQN